MFMNEVTTTTAVPALSNIIIMCYSGASRSPIWMYSFQFSHGNHQHTLEPTAGVGGVV